MRWPWQRRPAPAPDAELRRRIRKSFDDAAADEQHFPSTIDERIYHVQLLVEYFGDLTGRRILDAGCGKGRFSQALANRNPGALFHGMDISEEMLRRLPGAVAPCAGSLTDLPYADAVFDCAYAIESLEHAIEIERAVADLCRVVKPGGKIVIIDKNAEHWGKLNTPEWEKWFKRAELEKLLGRHCSEVSSRFISYWEDVAPDGLFIAWLARR